MLQGMMHMHVTSWALGLLLFIVAYVLLNGDKRKPAKIIQMILRLDYLLILITGGYLLFSVYLSSFIMPLSAEAITKGLAGIWLIGSMEMILVKKNKGKSTKGVWIQFIIALILVLVLGYGRLTLI